MYIHNQICNLPYYWTERRTWKSKRKSPGSFQISLALKKNKYVLEQGFLAFKLSNIFYMRHRDWSNPFPFHDELLQVFIPRMHNNYRIENRAYEEPAAILFTSATRKSVIPPPPVRLSWDSRHPPPESVRTDGRTLTSEPKFFGSTGYQIFLPRELHELRYKMMVQWNLKEATLKYQFTRNIDFETWTYVLNYAQKKL